MPGAAEFAGPKPVFVRTNAGIEWPHMNYSNSRAAKVTVKSFCKKLQASLDVTAWSVKEGQNG